MKWIGNHIISDAITRIRGDMYLERVSTTTETSVLVVDSSGLVSKNTTTLGGDITGVTAGTGLSGGGTGPGNVELNIESAQPTVTSLGTLTGLIIDGDKNVTPGDGAMLHVDSSTITDNATSGSGTADVYTHINFEAPAIAATNSSVTTTDAATLYIRSAPSAGTNQTITNPWSLWVDSGKVRFDGSLYMGETEAFNSSGLIRVVNQSGITGLGTLGSLAVTSSSSLGSPAVLITNADVDQAALKIEASNTTANILRINSSTLTTGSAISVNVDDANPITATKKLIKIDYDKSGDTESGETSSVIGLDIDLDDNATGNVGTSTFVGINIATDFASTNGTVTAFGCKVISIDSDTNVGYYSFTEGSDLMCVSPADANDIFLINTTTNAATTLTTIDNDDALAHFEIAADGDITLDANGQIKLEPVAGNNILLDGTVTVDGGSVTGVTTLGVGDSSISDDGSDNLIIQNTTADKDIVFKSDDGNGGEIEYFRLDGSIATYTGGANVNTVTNWPTKNKITFGEWNSFQIHWNYSNTNMDGYSGDIKIRNYADNKDIKLESDDGSGGLATYLTCDGSAETVVVHQPLTSSGVLTCSAGLTFDSVALTAVQTSAEAFVDNDTSVMTSAAIADKIQTNNVVFMNHHAFADADDFGDDGNDYWLFPKDARGVEYYEYDDDTDTVANEATSFTLPRASQHKGIIVPYACTLQGFYGSMSSQTNIQGALALWVYTPAWGVGGTGGVTATRRFYATGDLAGATSSYATRPAKMYALDGSDANIDVPIALSAGDAILPSLACPVDGEEADLKCSFTIVLKVNHI